MPAILTRHYAALSYFAMLGYKLPYHQIIVMSVRLLLRLTYIA